MPFRTDALPQLHGSPVKGHLLTNCRADTAALDLCHYRPSPGSASHVVDIYRAMVGRYSRMLTAITRPLSYAPTRFRQAADTDRVGFMQGQGQPRWRVRRFAPFLQRLWHSVAEDEIRGSDVISLYPGVQVTSFTATATQCSSSSLTPLQPLWKQVRVLQTYTL